MKNWRPIPINYKKWVCTIIDFWRIWPKWSRRCYCMKLWKDKFYLCTIQDKADRLIERTISIHLILQLSFQTAIAALKDRIRDLRKCIVWWIIKFSMIFVTGQNDLNHLMMFYFNFILTFLNYREKYGCWIFTPFLKIAEYFLHL